MTNAQAEAKRLWSAHGSGSLPLPRASPVSSVISSYQNKNGSSSCFLLCLCFSLLSSASTNTMTKKKRKEKTPTEDRTLELTVVVHYAGKSGQELKEVHWWRGCGREQLTGLLLTACSTCFPIQARTTCAGTALPTVCSALHVNHKARLTEAFSQLEFPISSQIILL